MGGQSEVELVGDGFYDGHLLRSYFAEHNWQDFRSCPRLRIFDRTASLLKRLDRNEILPRSQALGG